MVARAASIRGPPGDYSWKFLNGAGRQETERPICLFQRNFIRTKGALFYKFSGSTLKNTDRIDVD